MKVTAKTNTNITTVPATVTIQETTPPAIELAITFDELPYQMNREKQPLIKDGSLQKQVTLRIIKILQGAQVPATTFVVCDRLPPEQGLAQHWLQGGFSLGNQTSTLVDANTTPIAAWQEDVTACDQRLTKMNAPTPKWFRFPKLRRGWNQERDEALQNVLNRQNIVAVPATIPTLDHLYGYVYDQALTEGKTAFANTVLQDYVDHVQNSVQAAQALAIQRKGMPVPHIARFHVNQLNAHGMQQVISTLKRAGVKFITVHEAMQDPLYKQPNAYFGRAIF